MADTVPCLNPTRCGVQNHRAGSSAAANCKRSAGPGKGVGAPTLPVTVTHAYDDRDEPMPTGSLRLLNEDGSPADGYDEASVRFRESIRDLHYADLNERFGDAMENIDSEDIRESGLNADREAALISEEFARRGKTPRDLNDLGPITLHAYDESEVTVDSLRHDYYHQTFSESPYPGGPVETTVRVRPSGMGPEARATDIRRRTSVDRVEYIGRVDGEDLYRVIDKPAAVDSFFRTVATPFNRDLGVMVDTDKE